MSSAGFEVAIQAIKQQQTYAIDGTATEIGVYVLVNPLKKTWESNFLCNALRILQEHCFLEDS